MLTARVIPSLLLQDRALVKGVRFRSHRYLGDPINAVRLFNEMEVDELIILDISVTAKKRKLDFELIQNIASECFMPFTYGGGIRELDDMRQIFRIGVEKIAINTHAFEKPEFIRQAVQEFGSQSIVISIDVKKNLWGQYEVFVRNGKKATGRDPLDYAQEMETLGAGEILFNSIDRDGTWEGYDLKLLRKITQAVNIPVIASGGAGSVDHFVEAVKDGGASSVAAGSMFVYQGKDQGVLINFPKREELEKLNPLGSVK